MTAEPADYPTPRLLDLFCGGGGAGEGYARAGYQVTGVDIDPQPSYGHVGTFVRADALAVLRGEVLDLSAFDAIHASPPCQAYSTAVTSRSSRWNHTRGLDEPALIGVVTDLLAATGLPWAVENVAGARAAMPPGAVTLCGSMFGLPIPRHRLFASNVDLRPPRHPECTGMAVESARRLDWEYRDMSVTGKGRRVGTAARWAQLLDVRHPMREHDLAESVPPAYTAHVGACLLAAAPAPTQGRLW